MKIYARWGLAAFAGYALVAASLAADATNPMPGQTVYGGQPYYGPGYGPGYYGPMNNGCACCGQAYGWPPPGSQPFSGWQGPPPDCGGSGRCGLFSKRCGRRGAGGPGYGGDGGNGQVPTTAAFPTHPFARSPRDFFMLDQPTPCCP